MDEEVKDLERNLDLSHAKISKAKVLAKLSQKVDKYEPEPQAQSKIASTQQEVEELERMTLTKREELNKRVVNVEQLVS